MKILIKNPAPMDSRLKKWGDYHFGRSLTKYLERHGCRVESQYHGQWDQSATSDALLVIRGKYRYQPKKSHDGLNFLWVISHPEDVTDEELSQYDLVYVASTITAKTWSGRSNVPVKALLQCTDCEEFRTSDGDARRDVVFVGNTRGQKRPIVFLAARFGLRPKIWGRGWDQLDGIAHLEADYIDNERLGDLYRRSRLSLNDHWPDMSRLGFVNNRVFDALACGLPVLSDPNPGLDSLGLPGVLTAANDEQMSKAVSQYLFCYPSLVHAASTVRQRIETDFSFASRAKTILADISAMRA